MNNSLYFLGVFVPDEELISTFNDYISELDDEKPISNVEDVVFTDGFIERMEGYISDDF